MSKSAASRAAMSGDAIRLLVLSAVVVAVVAGLSQGVWLPNLHNGLLALAFAGVGSYVLHQQPENRCGTSFLATGVVEAVMFLGRQIGHQGGPEASPWWGWLGAWPLVVGLGLVTVSVILFPDGSLPSPRWRWVVASGVVLTTAVAATAALWPVGQAAAGVATPHPFTLAGAEVASDVWTVAARPTYVAFQLVWLVALAARWRTATPVVRRQLGVVGAAVAISVVALATGLLWWATPTAGVLAVCLVPIAAGWSIVHSQSLATHSALTWLSRRSDDDAALPAELAEAIADALAAEHVVVWARRQDQYHAVGMWPEPAEQSVPVSDLDQLVVGLDRPTREVRLVTRGATEHGAVVVERLHPLSRHDQRLLDGFCGQAALVLEHLAVASTATGNGSTGHLDHLTPREQEVLDLMAEGLSNAGICARLHLSIKTVEPVVSSVFAKLDLPPGRESNRRVLAVLARVDSRPRAPHEV
ncbi:hypothetical protein BH10ACT1_BH10ACT1_11610 [soil metagenome]